MSTSRNIRRFWLWVGIILLVELAAITLWKRWYWFFPSHAVSELYSKYAGADGINAAFVMDYRINDSVTVDVTLLEATDSNGWNMLRKDFNIAVLDSVTQKKIDNGKDLIFTKIITPENYSKITGSPSEDTIMSSISRLRKTVSVFHTQNEKERHAVIYYNFQKTIHKKTNST